MNSPLTLRNVGFKPDNVIVAFKKWQILGDFDVFSRAKKAITKGCQLLGKNSSMKYQTHETKV